MIRKIVSAIVLVPLAVLILVFAVANRQTVVFTLDPLGATGSELAFTLPLFALAFILVIIGVVVGGLATWLRQGKWRRAARKLDGEARALKAETAALKRRLEAAEAAKRTEFPKIALRPPAA